MRNQLLKQQLRTELDLLSSGWNRLESLGGKAGRHPSTRPWRFVTAKEQSEVRVDTMDGSRYQSYDGSGYLVEYDLQYTAHRSKPPNLSTIEAASWQLQGLNESLLGYREDMTHLRTTEWGSLNVRTLSVQVSLYNGNYDVWVDCWFLIEFLPNAQVKTFLDLKAFRP
jgi:hypothetical protein